MRLNLLFLLFFLSLTFACGGGGGGGGESDDAAADGGAISADVPAGDKVLAFNDLGMHCMDREFSIFSILPPFNVINAQVLTHNSQGDPVILDDSRVELRYDAVSDSAGSINTYSVGKTDFWQHAGSLFGTQLQAGEGLTGLFMPQDNLQSRGPQPMAYNDALEWFSAEGVPITPLDDNFRPNPYSLMRVSAYSRQTGKQIGFVDVVVPVASETDCRNCHATGQMAADDPGLGWSADSDPEVQSKQNILILHDDLKGTNLRNSTPVLCSRCHYSAPLDLSGAGPTGPQMFLPTFSEAMHGYHGGLVDNLNNPIFAPDATVEDSCYQCHPGSTTQCQRGAMKTGNIECTACHGDMLAVGGEFALRTGGSLDGANDGGARRPWQDLPRCQSCHTGDAVNHLTEANLVMDGSGIRLRQAYLELARAHT